MSVLGQTHPTMVQGPTDLDCEARFGGAINTMCPPGCISVFDACQIEQNNRNVDVRLDNPYMWTHRIVPGLVVGAVVGALVMRALR